MILSLFGFENKINFKEDKVNILEVYNKKLFCTIINFLNNQCNDEEDEDNQIVLLDGDNRKSIRQNVYILSDLFNIDFESKKIMNRIYNLIEQNIKNRQDFELEELSLKLRNFLIQEINELPFEFNIESEINVQNLIKSFNLRIDKSNYNSIVDKVEFIINILSTLKIASILIIPNLKVFLNDEELVEIYKYSIYNNINLLIIENNKYEKLLKYEQKNIIDEEFDEF